MSSNIRVQRICEYCGNEFTARTTRTRFCSHTCNSRAYKAKKKAEKLQEATIDRFQEITSDLAKTIRKSIEEIEKREFLSISEACILIGVSRWTLWRAIKNKELNAASIGKRKLIRRADIEALFNDPKEVSNKTIEADETVPEDPTLIDKSFYYTISEAQEKYSMSPKAFYDLLNRYGIQKIRKGKYVYIQKDEVDRLFIITPKTVKP